MARGRAFSSMFLSRDAAGIVYPPILDLGVLTESHAIKTLDVYLRMPTAWRLYALTESLAVGSLGLRLQF